MQPRVFSKGILQRVNRMAHVMKYNRIVNDEYLDQLPDQFYVPWFVMLHEHRAGKPCEPHVRCIFNHEGATFAIDVEMGCWEMLPSASEFVETMAQVRAQQAAGETNV